MSAAFGARAWRLAGVTARRLGWRPGEFWAATPAELAAALAPGEEARELPLSRAEFNRLKELGDERDQ